MNKRTKLIACVLTLIIGLSLAAYVSTARAQLAQPVMDITRLPPPRFEVKTSEPGKGIAFKLDRTTGQTWRLDDKTWIPLIEANPISNGNYDLQDTGGGYSVMRMETNTGQVWIAEKSKWMETK